MHENGLLTAYAISMAMSSLVIIEFVMTKTNTMTPRVSDELKAKLDRYAQLTGRSMSYVAAAAVEDYLSWRVPQLEDLEQAIEDADGGKFASPEDVTSKRACGRSRIGGSRVLAKDMNATCPAAFIHA